MHQFHESKNVRDFLCLNCCCMHIQDFYILLLKQLRQGLLVSSSRTQKTPNISHLTFGTKLVGELGSRPMLPCTIRLCMYSSSNHLYWRPVGRHRPSILSSFKILKTGKSFICLFCCMDLLLHLLKFSKILLLGFCEDGRAFGVCGESEGGNLCSVA